MSPRLDRSSTAPLLALTAFAAVLFAVDTNQHDLWPPDEPRYAQVAREMLESALDDYTGTIIVVSHDRYFLDRVTDKLLVIGNDPFGSRCLGKTELVAVKPTYSHYASLLRERTESRRQKLKASDAEP